MNSRLHLATLLLVLMATAPGATAQPPALADLTASRLEGSGPTNLAGSAQAVVYRSLQSEDRVDFTMTLDADRLHVAVDHAQSLISAGGAAVEGYLWTDHYNFTSVTLGLDSARPHFKVEVLALAGRPLQASHETNCMSLTAPATEQVEVSKRAHSPRPIPSVPTAGTIEVGLCPGTLNVLGDFLLVLWETNVTAVASDVRLAIHTGEGRGQARGPEGAVAPAEVPQKDQAYVEVIGGRLRLQSQMGSGGAIQAFLHHGDAALEGLLEASNARGHIFGLAGEGAPASSRVEFEGLLELDVQRQDAGVLARVFGEPRKLTLDGSPVELTAQSRAIVDLTATPRGIAVVSGALVLVLAAGGSVYLRRQYPQEPLRLALALHQHQAGHHRLALGLSRFLLRGRVKPDGWTLNARIHYDRQQWEQAFRWAIRADSHIADPQNRAKNALLACFAAARLQRPGDAGTWYRKAKQFDSSLSDAPDEDEPLLLMTAFREFGAV